MTNLDEMAKNLKELSKDPRARVRDIQQTLANGIITTDENGVALRAESKKDTAVLAISEEKWAVRAVAKKDTAIFATSEAGRAVDARSDNDVGVYATGGKFAGYFDGVVMVTGDIQLANADCAEEFGSLAHEEIEPGTVMVIDSENTVCQSTEAYDTCVAGVVSGLDKLKPGLVLGKQSGKTDGLPIALMGKVYCKVDASYGSVKIGDLLTTSNTPGYAMKASDHSRSFGAVIGKAMRSLECGRSLIPILVALQ